MTFGTAAYIICFSKNARADFFLIVFFAFFVFETARVAEVVGTFRNNREEIKTYWTFHHLTNASTEGFNNKHITIKR